MLSNGLTRSHSTTKIHPQQPPARPKQRGAPAESPGVAVSLGAGGQGSKAGTAHGETACSCHGILPLHKVPYVTLNLKGREVFWQAAASKCMPVPKGF